LSTRITRAPAVAAVNAAQAPAGPPPTTSTSADASAAISDSARIVDRLRTLTKENIRPQFIRPQLLREG
jgi:hypothetical protein